MEKEHKIMIKANKNATKRSSVAEHLVSNRECAKKYDLSRFKKIHHCNNVTDLTTMETTSIYLEKPDLNQTNKKNLIIKCLYLVRLSTLFPLVVFWFN